MVVVGGSGGEGIEVLFSVQSSLTISRFLAASFLVDFGEGCCCSSSSSCDRGKAKSTPKS